MTIAWLYGALRQTARSLMCAGAGRICIRTA